MYSDEINDYAVFTVCNLAYLPKALVLAESLLKYDRMKLIIYLIDKKFDFDISKIQAQIMWIEDAGVPNLYIKAFKYDITEFSTSLKPFLTLELLNKFKKVIFLDPDTRLYSSIMPIVEELNDHSIILTPHYTIPQSATLPDSDIGMMRFGSFNLGFYGIRKSEQSISFLKWWNEKCERFCYFETQFGLSTDQKWVTIAPCFFSDLHISFNLGYNVAFWNAHERSLQKDLNGNYIVNNKYPLVFFHFSSFDEQHPENLSKRPFSDKNRRRHDLLEISLDYLKSLEKVRMNSFKYGFDYMSGGEYISPTLRRAYACILNELPADHHPFDSSGVVGIFARKNHLIEKSNSQYISNSFVDISRHKNKFAFVYFLMRIILRFLGPNRFYNFSRLLVYLSSYRQIRRLWKY